MHSLPLDDFYSAEQGKGAQTPPPFPAPYPRFSKKGEPPPAENHRLRDLNFQAHLALESNSDFRLIPYWNQIPISGSFLDWKMLHAISLIPASVRTRQQLRAAGRSNVRRANGTRFRALKSRGANDLARAAGPVDREPSDLPHVIRINACAQSFGDQLRAQADA